MTDNPKSPPTFSVSNYEVWKVRVNLWTKFTDVDKTKRAFVIASTCVAEIPEIIKNILSAHDDDLSRENGLEFLLAKLDSYFAKSAELSSFDKFMDLLSLKRDSTGDVHEFVSSFRAKFNAVIGDELNMESICSMLVMTNGNFTSQETTLLKSVLLKDGKLKDLKVDSTCETIKNLLVDSTKKDEMNSELPVNKVSFRKGRKGKGKGKGKFNSNQSGMYGGFNSQQSHHNFDSRYSGNHSKSKGKGKRQNDNYGHGFSHSSYSNRANYS